MPPKMKKSKPGSGGAKAKKKAQAKAMKTSAKKAAAKNLVDKTFGMKNKKKSKKVQQIAENIANARFLSSQGKGNMRGVETTVAGREAQARKAKSEKLRREKKEKELADMLGAGYSLTNASSKKVKKEAQARLRLEKAKAEKVQAEQEAIDFTIPIVGLDQVMMCDGRSEVSRLLCKIEKREAMVRTDLGGIPLLDIKLVDGSTKYPVNMVIRGELAKSFGDKGFKKNKIVDIRDCVAIMRAVRGQPRRIQVEMVEATEKHAATTLAIASERLAKHCKALIVERDEVRARGGIPIEEMIEEERMALPPGGTPVTEKNFFKWLADRKARKIKEIKDKKAAAAKGKKGKFLTGKSLFAKHVELFVDDENGAEADVMNQRVTLSDEEDDEEEDAGGESKTAPPPLAPSSTKASTIQVGGKDVQIGDTSIFLDGDDDELDLDDLDD